MLVRKHGKLRAAKVTPMTLNFLPATTPVLVLVLAGDASASTSRALKMGEMVHFYIAFGDTTDPNVIAAEIAKELSFSQWLLRWIRDESDEGQLSSTWQLEGWQDDY